MTITARYASICPKCDCQIIVGATVEWARGVRASHAVCPAGGERVPRTGGYTPRRRFRCYRCGSTDDTTMQGRCDDCD